jgi:outer membrane protein TolC
MGKGHRQKTGCDLFVRTLIFAFWVSILGGCYASTPRPASFAPKNSQAKVSQEPVAKAAPAAGTFFTEDQVVGRILVQNGREEIVKIDREIALRNAKAAAGVENPELRLGRISSQAISDNRQVFEVGLRWNVPAIGDLRAKRDQTLAEDEIRMANREMDFQQVAYQARRLYSEIVFLQDQLALCIDLNKLEAGRRLILEQQAQIGELSEIDLLQAGLDQSVHAELCQSSQTRFTAKSTELKALMNHSGDIQVGRQGTKTPFAPVGVWLERAFVNRAELRQAWYRKEQALAQKHIERSKAIPWFTFIEPSFQTQRNAPEDQVENWGEVRIGLNLPIFNWHRPAVQANQLSADRYALDLARLQTHIELYVIQAYDTCQALQKDLVVSEKRIQGVLKISEEKITSGSAMGTVDPLGAVDLRIQMIKLQKALLDKRADYDRARIDLYRVAGFVTKDVRKAQADE